MADSLTSESMRKLFKNSFELIHYAIRMGRHCIQKGDGSLSEILDEVRRHPSEQYLEDLEAAEKLDDAVENIEKE